VASDALRGRLIFLRPLSLSDAADLDTALRDRHVSRMLPTRVRREGGRRFVVRAIGEARQGRGPAFAVVPLGFPRAVGQVRFIDWSRSERRAEIGYWLRRTHWGKGYGTEAVRLACAYGFREMRLHRIEARVVAGNERSVRVLERSGFRLEGRARKAIPQSGRWVDELHFGLLGRERRIELLHRDRRRP